MNKFFFTLLGSGALLYASCATEIRIDPARSVITFQKAAQKSLAEDLQLHLKQITGKEIPVCPENSSPGRKICFCGRQGSGGGSCRLSAGRSSLESYA